MGEEFIGKRNKGTCRRRDKQRYALYGANLFAGCAPEQITSVAGMVQNDVKLAPGDRLWTENVPPSGPISFYSGNELALNVSGSGADYIRTKHACQSVPLVAEVRSLSASGIVQIQARAVGG